MGLQPFVLQYKDFDFAFRLFFGVRASYGNEGTELLKWSNKCSLDQMKHNLISVQEMIPLMSARAKGKGKAQFLPRQLFFLLCD